MDADTLTNARLDQKRVVWVAEVVDRATLVRLIRAALLHGVAGVKLSRTPVEKGTHTLQLRLNGEPLVVLAAESKGRGTKAGFPLLLAPLDPSHVPELQAIVNAGDGGAPSSAGPMSSRASAIFDSEPPLPVAMRGHAKTVPDPEPYEDEEEEETDPYNEERLGKSTLFDPDAAVIGRAPSRANTDDTLTIPARASMLPPHTPAARTPRNNVDLDALSTARSAATPLVAGMSEARITPRQVSSSGYSSVAPATPEPVEGTLIMVDHADPVTSQSNVHTLRTRDDEITDWDTDGPDAPDPSLSESVVFDPEILAREVRHSAPAPAGVPPTVTDPPTGADGESISVIFGNEETLQGAGAGPPSEPVGIVVARHVDDELSLTPTAPIDVPPKKPPSKRKDPSQRVTEDSDTFPSASATDPDPAAPPRHGRHSEPPQRIPSHMPKPGQSSARVKAAPPASSQRQPPATVGAVSMPRTQKRNTAQMITGGRIIANRYRIETLVGAGAVGAVFKAAHVDLPRTFAIKLLHPHYRADPHLMASFRAEARAASLLDHPNVTVVHDFGEEPDGLVYIVMEYLQGINLQALLDEERRLSPRRAIEIMLQVCGALSAAHERGIVHRDVKPDNIMLVPTRDDEGDTYDLVKVCDFGIAALETAPGAEGGEITAGTPEYMAPEQAAGRADARTDVYACGIVLYEMLIGKPPFVGETAIGTLAKHAKERAKRPSEIIPDFPPALEAIIMCAIEKQPERRFQKMRDLRAQLKRLLG